MARDPPAIAATVCNGVAALLPPMRALRDRPPFGMDVPGTAAAPLEPSAPRDDIDRMMAAASTTLLLLLAAALGLCTRNCCSAAAAASVLCGADPVRWGLGAVADSAPTELNLPALPKDMVAFEAHDAVSSSSMATLSSATDPMCCSTVP